MWPLPELQGEEMEVEVVITMARRHFFWVFYGPKRGIRRESHRGEDSLPYPSLSYTGAWTCDPNNIEHNWSLTPCSSHPRFLDGTNVEAAHLSKYHPSLLISMSSLFSRLTHVPEPRGIKSPFSWLPSSFPPG